MLVSIIHRTVKIFGGVAYYHQTIIGVVLSIIPFYFGLMLIGIALAVSSDATMALMILWPTSGVSLSYLWWMFKHYYGFKGIRLFLSSSAIFAGISSLCFIIALMLAAGART